MAHNNLGVALQDQGNLEEALVAFREAMRLKPDDGATHNSLALVLAALPAQPGSEYDEALVHARRAVELGPDKGNRYTTLPLAEYRVGHWTESLAASERSMALQKRGDALIWFLMAQAQWQKGEQERARGSFDQAVAAMNEDHPQHPMFSQLWTEAATVLGQPGP